MRFTLISIFSSLLSSFIIQYMYFGFDYEATRIFMFETHSEIFLIGSFVLLPISLLISALFGSSIIGSSLTILLSSLIGLTAHFKFQYRNEPLFPNELSMITEIPFLVRMISRQELMLTILALIFITFLIYILYRFFSLKRKGVLSLKVHVAWRLVIFIVASGTLFYIGQFNRPDNKIKILYSNYTEWVTYDQNRNYSNNGFIASFLFNIGSEYMEEPEGYSLERIEVIYEKYSLIAQKINTERDNIDLSSNIIYIMNESFSDPSLIDGFSYNEDPIPYTRILMENTLSGYSLSQSYGGGTSNSEFEALTGFAIEPFASHIYSPYVEAFDIMYRVPSIVSRVNNNNFTATAIHPFNPSLYRRTSVYDTLGFDSFIHEDDMTYKEKLENSQYISDESAYKEVIQELKSTDTNDFIHLVTMQNHMSYGYKYEDPSFSTVGATSTEEGDGYLQDLYYSDLALETFINEIDNFNEETLIVFWGDHLPSIYSEEVIEKNNTLAFRETPLFFYSNKKELSGDIGTISPVFFINHILEILNVEVTPFEALLAELETVLPGIYGGLYLERGTDNPVLSRSELNKDTLEVLNDFHLIQYDIVSGSGYSQRLDFFDDIE